MKKRGLAKSLLVTTLMMSSMVGNVFADSTVSQTEDSNTTVVEKHVHNTGKEQQDKLVKNGKIYTSKENFTISLNNGHDKFVVKINKVGKPTLGGYSDYVLQTEVKKNGNRDVVYFKLITDKGSALGNIARSQNFLDRDPIQLPDGKTQYDFHATLYGGGTRTINIIISALDEKGNPTVNKDGNLIDENGNIIKSNPDSSSVIVE